MIIYGGKEMELSIKKLFNAILQKISIPNESEMMKIKCIYKSKGPRKQLKNRSGLCITDIISKLFEKTFKEKIEDNIQISEQQCGGKGDQQKTTG